MIHAPLPPDARVVVLSGAGLSKASGVPTFRDADGLWEGHRVEDVATPAAWTRNRELVRRFYDLRRNACARVEPNPGHLAMARLQQTLGPARCALITQNIDGLLQKGGCPDVIEMHGSLWRLRCEYDEHHPRVPVHGDQDPQARCEDCGALLRPDVVWFDEMPYELDRIEEVVIRCTVFLSVGTSGVVYPAAGLSAVARRMGAHCIEVNPVPSGSSFHEVLAEPAETALPSLVDRWLGGDA